MSSPDNLAPPGSSTYSSNSMFVGDGTWDAERNTFLLPNLVGLNFETMRYNGMANRFRDLAQYHNLIRGHGVVAAITFLGVVPAAIIIARFYHGNPRLALRLHIWLQILTLALTTVVFVLGWFAVGEVRSLTNPHHGIGLALFVLILVQTIGGWWIHKREKGKSRIKIPVKLMLHQWHGRAIALLGIAQVPLGLTLYGSPRSLFILYALYMTALVVFYFILTYRYQGGAFLDDEGSYISGSRTDVTSNGRSRSRRGLGALAAAGAAGAGIAALRRRSRSRNRNTDESRTHGGGSRRSSRRRSDSFVDEKYTEDGTYRRISWRDRLLGATAGVGALAALRSFFDRRGGRDEDSDSGHYTAPFSGTGSVSQTDLSRLEEGRPPASPANGRLRRTEGHAAVLGTPSRRRRSGDSVGSFDSRDSFSPSRDNRRSHGLRDGLAALGVAGYLRHMFKQRRERKEDRRVEEMRRREVEDERINRMKNQRYTGDGQVPRRGGRRGSFTDSSAITGSNPELSRTGIPPIPTDITSRTNADERIGQAGPSTPRNPRRIAEEYSSGSEEYTSPGGRQHRRHRDRRNTAGGTARQGENLQQGSSNGGDSVTSPPVSVKVKMHGDGRHVTLRRLNEAEAAAEREARRRDRSRRRRGGSVSSLSGIGDDRWRRVEAREAAQARQMQQQQQQQQNAEIPPPPVPPAHRADPSELHLPSPPPMPGASGPGNSNVGSPGTATAPYETGTDVSAYDSNRRRRRAERAQAKLARAGGSRVEFE